MDGQLSLQLNADIPPEWEAEVELPQLSRAATAVLQAEGLAGEVEIGLLIVDDEEIRRLNARYRGLDVATDVLSFPLRGAAEEDGFVGPPDHVVRLGDVVVSFPHAQEQAREYGHSLARELGYLLVHGVLHLLGYDHEEEAERLRMRAKEEAALAAVGLTR